jgi:hypothetical protein
MNPLGAFGVEVNQLVVLAHGAQASLGVNSGAAFAGKDVPIMRSDGSADQP